ncbi:MAG: glycosyltransferase, partial [Pseudomonadota bacterium]
MKIAYFMNSYPMTSTTFVRQEIEAHERAGWPVARYAARLWDGELVEPRDVEERERTTYLLAQGGAKLLGGLAAEAARNPVGMARAVFALVRLIAAARGEVVRHVAYLSQAVFLKRDSLAAGVEHIHSHFSTNSAAVAMLCRLLGGPSYSFTAHGPDEFFDVGMNALREKSRRAAFVAAISDYCRGVILAAAGADRAERVRVVRCGVDVEEFAAAGPAADPPKRLVCVGRLCKVKSQAMLVEAFARVRDRHPDAELLLIGDGEERPAVEAAVGRLGLDGAVKLLGWRSNREVRETIVASRALVLASLAEGLPVVLMESLALERPVVTTEIAGVPELVDEGC